MVSPQAKVRRKEVIRKLNSNPRGVHDVLSEPRVIEALKLDAAENGQKALIPQEILDDYLKFAQVVHHNPHRLQAAGGAPVLLVPGFLGSELTDTSGGNDLIWLDPTLVTNGDQLSALQLDTWRPSFAERDAQPTVNVIPRNAVPLAYDLLTWRLFFSGYETRVFPYDWRKNLEESAQLLAQRIRGISASSRGMKVRLIAHSQGSLVARRALQILGEIEAARIVEMLILLGPATSGTFTAALAISGGHEQLQLFQNWAINAPANVADIFQSMSGLYQLLPWNPRQFPAKNGVPLFDVDRLKASAFWESGVDAARLKDLFGWAGQIDTRFFNSRTRIILGQDQTAAAVEFKHGKMVVTQTVEAGDGVVLDQCAKLPGVRAYKAEKARHAWMAATFNVTSAVLTILSGNDPVLTPSALALDGDQERVGVIPVSHFEDVSARQRVKLAPRTAKSIESTKASDKKTQLQSAPPPPTQRRLRVFSIDPLLMSDPDTAAYGTMELAIPWEGPGQSDVLPGELLPGPVGEYVEVVDVDPQSGRFYYPVDLNHPHVLHERGLAPSESNPQFHQQMVYAVSMATIRSFESALGRVALWSPRLVRNDAGEVDKSQQDTFVQRLRIYPHAMRQRNAYYDPEKKSLLFGYFPSASSAGRLVRPGATVFTCLSFDIIAHETTHALLDGLHRYFNTPSNSDVFAFHEAFADVVALLQRFGNQGLMQRQMRLSKGKLTNKSLLGQLGGQFGEASGGRAALRQYLGKFDEHGEWMPIKPNADDLSTEMEPHKRGALLVAAMFQALNSMYEQRSGGLFDVATRDDGTTVFTRELENHLAQIAASVARHLLEMAIRALDYVPPVDITFGDYLRGLITADNETHRNDPYHYRAAIVNAFAQWGIYPSDLKTLVPESLAWDHPPEEIAVDLQEWLEKNSLADWGLGLDRAAIFHESRRLAASLHEWIAGLAPQASLEFQTVFGLNLSRDAANRSIRRNSNHIPVFEVHSVRPCHRVASDGQSRRDVIIEIVQKRKAFFDVAVQKDMDSGKIAYDAVAQDFYFRGGSTLVIDGRTGKVRYMISKNINSRKRLQAEREFRSGGGSHSLAANYFHGLGEQNPFRLMHEEH